MAVSGWFRIFPIFFFFAIIQEVCKAFRSCLGSGYRSFSKRLPLSVPSFLALLGVIP